MLEKFYGVLCEKMPNNRRICMLMKHAPSFLILFLIAFCCLSAPVWGQKQVNPLPAYIVRLDIVPLFINSINISYERQLGVLHRVELALGYIHPNARLQKVFSDNFGSAEMMHYGGRLQATYKWIKRSHPGGRMAFRGLQFETVYKQFNNRVLFQKAPPPATSADDYNLLLSHKKTQLGLRYQFSFQRGVKFCLEYGWNFGVAVVREHTSYAGVQRMLTGPFVAPVTEKEMLPRDNTWYLRPLLRVFVRVGLGFGTGYPQRNGY